MIQVLSQVWKQYANDDATTLNMLNAFNFIDIRDKIFMNFGDQWLLIIFGTACKLTYLK